MDDVGFELAPPGLLGPGRAAVSERSGGVSSGPFRSLNLGRSTADDPGNVRRNEGRVLAALGLADRVARLRLEHGARVLTVDAPGLHGPADALRTGDPRLVLWITVADCFPLALAAGSVRMLGHCGWRGVAAGLVEAMIASLREASRSPLSEIRAWVGPGIQACCYQFGRETASRFSPRALRPLGDDWSLDLRGEILARLAGAGVAADRTAASESCTCCLQDRFFSHRRDGVPAGRMAALCWTPQAVRGREPVAPGAQVRSPAEPSAAGPDRKSPAEPTGVEPEFRPPVDPTGPEPKLPSPAEPTAPGADQPRGR